MEYNMTSSRANGYIMYNYIFNKMEVIIYIYCKVKGIIVN